MYLFIINLSLSYFTLQMKLSHCRSHHCLPLNLFLMSGITFLLHQTEVSLCKLNLQAKLSVVRSRSDALHFQESALAVIPGQNKILMTLKVKPLKEHGKEKEANTQKQKEKNRIL